MYLYLYIFQARHPRSRRRLLRLPVRQRRDDVHLVAGGGHRTREVLGRHRKPENPEREGEEPDAADLPGHRLRAGGGRQHCQVLRAELDSGWRKFFFFKKALYST